MMLAPHEIDKHNMMYNDLTICTEDRDRPRNIRVKVDGNIATYGCGDQALACTAILSLF